jgi:hypothetical protein
MENQAQPQTESVKNKIIPFSTLQLILIVIIVYIVGVATSFFLDPFLPTTISHTKKAYEAGNKEGIVIGHKNGFEEAKNLVEKSSFGKMFAEQSLYMYSISGTIQSIQGNTFVIRDERMRSPFDTESIQDRTVVVSTTSEIFTMSAPEKKSDKELQSMLLKIATSSVTTVSPYTKIKSDFSSLVIGMNVKVVAKENIKKLEKFEALEVNVIPKIVIK